MAKEPKRFHKGIVLKNISDGPNPSDTNPTCNISGHAWVIDTSTGETVAVTCFNPCTEVITKATHGLSNGQLLKVTTVTCAVTTCPANLLAINDKAYVICAAACTFKLSATRGGSAINITSAGSLTFTVMEEQMQAYLCGAAEKIVTDTNTISMSNKTLTSPVINGAVSGTAIDTSLCTVSCCHDTIPSAKAVKTYVDAQVTAQDLDINVDGCTSISIDLDSESLTLTGGTGVTTSAACNTVTVAIDCTVATLTGCQTLTNKTIAAASNQINTAPSGNLTSTELNAALAELQGDIDTRAVASTTTAHICANSCVHGVTGSVVGTSDAQTLTNKALDDTTTTFQNTCTTSKKAKFNLSCISACATRTFTLPNTNTTLVGTDSTQTIYNKTINILGTQLTVQSACLVGTMKFSVAANASSRTNLLLNAPCCTTICVSFPSSTDTLVGRATTDTLTNKTINCSKVGTGCLSASSVWDTFSTTKGSRPSPSMTEAQRNAIACPVTGLMVYNTCTNKYNSYNGSAWTTLGGGGAGSGGINYDSDPYFQDYQCCFVSYDDGACGFANGTGGTVDGVTITVCATDTQILNGDYKGTLKMAVASGANYTGEGIAKTYSIPKASRDEGQIYVSGRISTDSGFSTGDFGLYFYDSTCGNNVILPYSGLTCNHIGGLSAGSTGRFTVRVPIYNDTTCIRMAFHTLVDTTGGAKDLIISDIKIGPDSLVDAPIVNAGVDVSSDMTLTNAGNAVITSAVMARTGNKATFKGRITMGATAPTGNIIINLPSYTTIDTSETGTNMIGTVTGADTFSAVHLGHAYITGNGFLIYGDDATGTWTATNPFTWASGDILDFNVEVPITEWANQSGTLSTTEMMNQTPVTRIKASSTQNITTTATTKITLDTVMSNNVGAADTSNSRINILESGSYDIALSAYITGYTANEAYSLLLYKNGSLLTSKFKESDNTSFNFTFTETLDLVKGDYLEMYSQSTADTNYNVSETLDRTSLTVKRNPDLTVYSTYNTCCFTPVGTIVSWIGGYFGDGSNGSFTSVLGNTICAVNCYLPSGWRVADGSLLNDGSSPIFNGSGRYLPNLTDDRFLMGDTVAGAIGGSNTMTDHTHTFSLTHAHTHSINHNHASFNTASGGSHTHGVVDPGHFHYLNGELVGNPGGTNAARGNHGANDFTSSTATTGITTNTTGSSHVHAIDVPNFTGTSGAASTSTVAGSVGTGSAATSTENRPKYLGVFYIMRVK